MVGIARCIRAFNPCNNISSHLSWSLLDSPVALPSPVGAAFQLHSPIASTAAFFAPSAAAAASRDSFAIGAPLACLAALFAAAPAPNLEDSLSQFAATRAHLVRCVSARVSALPVSAESLFSTGAAATATEMNRVDLSRACTDAVRCIADALQPLAGIGVEYDETQRAQAAELVAALIEPCAVLWQACGDVDVALVASLCATVVGACRAVGSDARLLHSSLSAVCACAIAIVVALENAPSQATTLPLVDALAVALNACAQLLEVCILAPTDAEVGVHATVCSSGSHSVCDSLRSALVSRRDCVCDESSSP